MWSIRVFLICMSTVSTLNCTPALAAEGRSLDRTSAGASASGELLFYDALALDIEGQGWPEVASPYNRLPQKAKDKVRPRIWELSGDTAGLCVRFCTDAPKIHARWKLRKADLA